MATGLRMAAVPVDPVSAQALTREAPSAMSQARAAVVGLELGLFGREVALGASSAAAGANRAEASGAGVATSKRTVASTKVDAPEKRDSARACLPDLAVLKSVEVRMACGESRVHTLPPVFTGDSPVHAGAALLGRVGAPASDARRAVDNGGPQAVGRGSVGSVALRDTAALAPAVDELEGVLRGLDPAGDGTVGGAVQRVEPEFQEALASLARSTGLGPTDHVGPLSALLQRLVDGARNVSSVLVVTLADGSAQVNTHAGRMVALAAAGGGQIDLLPGLVPQGGSLLSVLVGPATCTTSVDRETAVATPTCAPGAATIRLGLPLLGGDISEAQLEPDRAITVLAGTRLETTVSVGSAHSVRKDDGSVASFWGGASVRFLKGAKDGIDLRLSRAESGVGEPVAKGRDGPPAIAGAVVAVAVATTLIVSFAVLARRRFLAAHGRPRGR